MRSLILAFCLPSVLAHADPPTSQNDVPMVSGMVATERDPLPPRPSEAASAPQSEGFVEAESSKKTAYLAEKHDRKSVHAKVVAATAPVPVVTLHNVWTHESLPLDANRPVDEERFSALTRCHYTNQATQMDRRLADVIVRAARKFAARTIEVVSGFRAPKYQLMLRKKGREVARDSQHPRGTAVDFRIPQVSTKKLLRFVKSLRLGGVGYYPHSSFVHADTGRVRFWKGN